MICTDYKVQHQIFFYLNQSILDIIHYFSFYRYFIFFGKNHQFSTEKSSELGMPGNAQDGWSWCCQACNGHQYHDTWMLNCSVSDVSLSTKEKHLPSWSFWPWEQVWPQGKVTTTVCIIICGTPAPLWAELIISLAYLITSVSWHIFCYPCPTPSLPWSPPK